jgi:hypothetical protein
VVVAVLLVVVGPVAPTTTSFCVCVWRLYVR